MKDKKLMTLKKLLLTGGEYNFKFYYEEPEFEFTICKNRISFAGCDGVNYMSVNAIARYIDDIVYIVTPKAKD